MAYLEALSPIETTASWLYSGNISVTCSTSSMSTAYHPQTNGQAERTNKTVLQWIRIAFLKGKYWVSQLPDGY